MKIYVIKQKYFDNGKVIVWQEKNERESLPQEIFIEKEKYDYYETFFKNKKEAQEFLKGAKNA